ncbi:hypothetical protein GGF32_002927 [Allomyces javanicus]|nr:hypothetical protein GGF32_002927 [Allomyces javanicus]
MQSVPNAMETWFGFIRSIDDAVTVVEAARTGYLPRVTRRLTEDERMVLIRSGSVFVFEESESQVRRWADSRNWSSSRMKGYFLVYSEQEVSRSAPATGDEPDQDAAAAAASAAASSTTNTLLHHHAGQTLNKRDSAISLLSRRSSASTLASIHDVPPARPLLKKKALSLTTAFGNKLRLISYYAEADVAEGILPTPDNDPLLTKIQVADNLYYAGNDGPIALSKTSTTRQPLPGPGHATVAPDAPASTMQQQHQQYQQHAAPQQPPTTFALTPLQLTTGLVHGHQPVAHAGAPSYAMQVDQPAFLHHASPAVARGPPPPAPLSLPHPSPAVADMQGHPPLTNGPFGAAPATHQPNPSLYPSEPIVAPAHEEAAPIPRRGLRTAISLEHLSSTTTAVGHRRLSQSASLGHLPHLSMPQGSPSAGPSPRMGHTRTPSAGSITIPKALKRRSDPLPQFVWRGPSMSSFTAAPTIPEAPPVHEATMHSPMSIVSRQLSPMDTDAPPPPAPATPEPATASMRRRSLYDPVIVTGTAAAAAEAASRRHSVHLGVALDRPAGDWRVSARYDRTVHAEDARQLRALDRSFNL